MMSNDKLCLEVAASAHSAFLANLEHWLEATIDCNLDSSEAELVKIAVEKYRRAIDGNIEYHAVAANLYEGEPKDTRSPFYYRHKLLAAIYKTILSGTK